MFQAFDQNQTRFVVAPWAPQLRVTGGDTGDGEGRRVDVLGGEDVAGRHVAAPRAEHELLAALEDVRLRAADRPRRAPAGRVPFTLST